MHRKNRLQNNALFALWIFTVAVLGISGATIVDARRHECGEGKCHHPGEEHLCYSVGACLNWQEKMTCNEGGGWTAGCGPIDPE